MSDVWDQETLPPDDDDNANLDDFEEDDDPELEFQIVLFLNEDRGILHIYKYYTRSFGAIENDFNNLELFIAADALAWLLSEDTGFQTYFVFTYFSMREE